MLQRRMIPLLACLAITAGLLAKHTPADDSSNSGKADWQARADRFGDPLPPRAIARLGCDRLRHGGSVTAIAYSPDGKLLASASNGDNQVLVWQMPSGKCLHQFTVPGTESDFLLFSRDGTRLASSAGNWGRAKVVQVWDLKTGKELIGDVDQRLYSYPNAIALSADGKTIAVDKSDRAVHIWDLETGRQMRKLPAEGTLRALAFPSDDQLLALAVEDKKVVLWDLTAGRKRHTFLAGGKPFAPVAISPDGRLLASESADKVINVYDGVTGQELHRLDGHTGPIYSLTFSRDGKTLLSGSSDTSVRLWELERGKERLRLTTRPGGLPFAALSPDGKTVATGGANSPHAVILWDATTGKKLDAFPGQTSPIASVAFSPNGKLVATSSWVRGEQVVWLWETNTGRPVRTFPGHEHGTTSVAFSPDGKWLASAGWHGDSTIRIWDVETGREVRKFPGHEAGATCLAFAPNGKQLASGDDSCDRTGTHYGRVRLWDLTNEKLVHEFAGTAGAVQAVAFTPDGRTLLLASNGVHCWEVANRRYVGGFALEKRLWSLALSADGKVLATADGLGPVCLWEIASRRQIGTLPAEFNGPRVASAPDERFVAVGTEGAVRLYDWSLGKPCLSLTGHRGLVATMAFSPDGKSLIGGGGKETSCLLWDVSDVMRHPAEASERLEQADLDRLWEDLRAEDAGAAYRAVWVLVRVPGQAVTLLRAALRPAPLIDRARVERLIKELDDKHFETRQTAALELELLGESVAGPLLRVLKGQPSPELRSRVERLLKKLEETPDPWRLRGLRAVVVLEQIGTPAARQLLRDIAHGDPGARLTQDAKAALSRLKDGT